MRVAIGADHGGLPLKDDIMEVLEADGHEVLTKRSEESF